MGDTPLTDNWEFDSGYGLCKDVVFSKSVRDLERHANAMAEALHDMLRSGKTFDDDRIDYIEMQIDRVTLADALATETAWRKFIEDNSNEVQNKEHYL